MSNLQRKMKRAVVAGMLMTTLFTSAALPVFAADKEEEAFAGWNEETKSDAWTVYAMTDWSVYSKELQFGKAKSEANATNIASDIELQRDRIRGILKDMDESLGIYPNEDYTELILCLIQVLSNGTLVENDPAQVCKYIKPNIPAVSMTFEKSIKELFRRVSACESAYDGTIDLFTNDEKLKSMIQGVVFSPNYTKKNKEYSVENATEYKEKNKDELHGNPSVNFAEEVAKHYKCTSVTGGLGTGSGDIVIEGNGIFANPCPGASVSSPFGYRTFDNSFHNGLDLAAPTGTPTYAAEDGVVMYAFYSESAGNWVVLDHGNGLVTKYMHHDYYTVQQGQHVKKGQQVGVVGNTGYSFGAHLHFQVEVNGTPVDPQLYL